MLRRTLLACLIAFPFAAGAQTLDYTPGLVTDRLAQGEVLFVDFAADWCGTCRSQERTIASLRSENPAYDAITFVRVDWDEYGRSAISQELAIPRRSTLVVLSDGQELGRIVAGTRREDIQALLDTALAAATS
ncbi:MAG: thioredoxin family protein [Shimia sp.]